MNHHTHFGRRQFSYSDTAPVGNSNLSFFTEKRWGKFRRILGLSCTHHPHQASGHDTPQLRCQGCVERARLLPGRRGRQYDSDYAGQVAHPSSAGRKKMPAAGYPVAGLVLIVAHNKYIRCKASCQAGQAQRPAWARGSWRGLVCTVAQSNSPSFLRRKTPAAMHIQASQIYPWRGSEHESSLYAVRISPSLISIILSAI